MLLSISPLAFRQKSGRPEKVSKVVSSERRQRNMPVPPVELCWPPILQYTIVYYYIYQYDDIIYIYTCV